MTDSSALQSAAYVCVVSEYNLPALESCLAHRPSDVLLVVSDKPTLLPAAQRLEQRLHALLPGVRVHVLHRETTGRPLGGDDVIESQQWTREVLGPRLQQADLAGKPHSLNFTGGTKAMTIALLSGYAWQTLDYKAQDLTELQMLCPAPADGTRPATFQALPRVPLTDVSPLDVAALHGNDVHIDPLNAIILARPAESLQLARTIWLAQQEDEEPLRQLFQCLERLWVERRDDPELRQNRIRLDWLDFLPQGQVLTGALEDWLQRFQALEPEALRWDATGVELPGNNPRKTCRNLREWISGDWLEQLAYHWLLEEGIPERAIARNLKSGTEPGQSGSQREVDLLVHHRSNTRLVEIKAGLPPGHAPSELENQVSSLGSRFGKNLKALLVSPQLQQQLQAGKRWENFELRCKANGIQLLASREGLLDFVRSRKN